jgi:dTDP-L-rhamnose 4-epimerase
MRILITGGAGFIGSHLARYAIEHGCDVTVLDNFSPQVHTSAELPGDIEGRVKLLVGDVADMEVVRKSLAGQEVVVHLAAETGTGQSMYSVRQYERVNGLGTANLLECLVNDPDRSVTKIVVASSRAVYGEGKYHCATHGVVYPGERLPRAMETGKFEPTCPICSAPCTPLPTDESAPVAPSSYYGLTKYVQERAVFLFARAMNISSFALRFQNVFGPGQSLSNPYTGILAVFSNLARENKPINIFEDGHESRDFVYVVDAVNAIWRCLDRSRTGNDVYNVGTGIATSVAEVASGVKAILGSSSELRVSGAFRKGDIRHSIADVSKAVGDLGFLAKWEFRRGLEQFLNWSRKCEVSNSGYEKSLEELKIRGLMRG